MMLYAYREYLMSLPVSSERQVRINAINRGTATVKNSELASLVMALGFATRQVKAIADLSLMILRNHSGAPYVMGDTPCVLSNHYMRQLKRIGVLGLFTPGLMAVLPIDCKTQVLFYDPSVYKLHYSSGLCLDIFSKSDVSRLNALQIHAAEENVYFAHESCQEYLEGLLSAHRPLLQNERATLIVHPPGELMIDGVPNSNEIMHTFEPQLPVTLDLSCIETSPLPRDENPNRPRNPDLARDVEMALELPGQWAPPANRGAFDLGRVADIDRARCSLGLAAGYRPFLLLSAGGSSAERGAYLDGDIDFDDEGGTREPPGLSPSKLVRSGTIGSAFVPEQKCGHHRLRRRAGVPGRLRFLSEKPAAIPLLVSK
jgi:hypothetical protein